MKNKKTFWERYPNFYENFTVFLVILLFIFAGISGISALLHPWLLIIIEFIKAIKLPSILTSDKLLKWEFQGICNFFKHKVFYVQNKQNYNFKNKQYIKCLMPHGIMPFTIWCLWGDKNEEDVFNWKNNNFVAAHQMYEFPFISHYAKACNAIPSNYSNMENVLKENKSLIVYPGGLREMFACSHKQETIVINKREGIFYLAIKNGVPLLPIYTFGITTIYERSGVTVTLPFFFKNDKDSVSWYYGKYNTPFPLKKKLITVVGSPIYVTKKDNITKKDINNLRNRYIIITQKLYNNWCVKYNSNWKKKELVIE
jgi:1-acyl-sn-glycerol-3-phosphate acyltransferase